MNQAFLINVAMVVTSLVMLASGVAVYTNEVLQTGYGGRASAKGLVSLRGFW
jgi:hypothetical protein